MSAPSAVLPTDAVDAPAAPPAAAHRTQPFRWSLRRELWENRSAYLAPAGVGAFAVVALVIHAGTMPSHMPGLLANDPANPGSASTTYGVAMMLMLATALITGAFYSLEALSSERRDRSILFWKSMPVSDGVTVLAKAAVPLTVLPVVTFAVVVAIHLVLFLLSALALLIKGYGVAPLWQELQLFRTWGVLAYALAAMTLWHAPVYAFLLLVSGWARRTAALWAVLPLLAAGVLEKITMDTNVVASLVLHRLAGWYHEAFVHVSSERVPFGRGDALTPGRFLDTPDLWMGLVLAAVFLAAAARLRRYREPI